MDLRTQRKWDRAARSFDFMNGFGPELRWGPAKRELYSSMEGHVLFCAVGTGLDIQFFPAGKTIVGIDISAEMLARARPRAEAYDGSIDLVQADVHQLDFDDHEFDQVFTSCTFCSVPRPVEGLRSLRRVLRPGGELRMFEHTGSRYVPFRPMLALMSPLARRVGPELNRDTLGNVQAAGFRVIEVRNVFLDVVKTITAVTP